MANRSVTNRLAYIAFAAAVMSLLGPGLHYGSNPQASRSQVAFEASVLGLIIATLAITLAILALRRFPHESEKAGIGWARSGLGLAGVSAAIWVVALVIGGRG